MRNQLFFLFLFAITNYLSAQDTTKLRLFQAPEFVASYTTVKMQNQLRKTIPVNKIITANNTFCGSLGVNVYTVPIGVDTLKNKSIFSLGFGVSMLKYTVNNTLLPPDNQGWNPLYTYTPSNFRYDFKPIELYLTIGYTKFVSSRCYLSARAGFGKVMFTARDIEILSSGTVIEALQDSSGGDWHTDTTITETVSKLHLYPGNAKGVNYRFDFQFGYKLKRFMPFISYQHEKNRAYYYNKFGIGLLYVLEGCRGKKQPL